MNFGVCLSTDEAATQQLREWTKTILQSNATTTAPLEINHKLENGEAKEELKPTTDLQCNNTNGEAKEKPETRVEEGSRA